MFKVSSIQNHKGDINFSAYPIFSDLDQSFETKKKGK